ncbi:MAG: hypothetical protein ACI9XJ_002024, partial [Marivirga sp.]
MSPSRNHNLYLISAGIALTVLIMLSLSFGSVLIDATTLWKGLIGNLTESEATYHILYNF